MKIALILLGLLGVLHAKPLNYGFSDEVKAFGTFIEPKHEAFPTSEEDAVQVPTTRPPQIHHNTVKSQGPFSGLLVNALVNEKGTQETVQETKIQYSINGVARTVIDDLEARD